VAGHEEQRAALEAEVERSLQSAIEAVRKMTAHIGKMPEFNLVDDGQFTAELLAQLKTLRIMKEQAQAQRAKPFQMPPHSGPTVHSLAATLQSEQDRLIAAIDAARQATELEVARIAGDRSVAAKVRKAASLLSEQISPGKTSGGCLSVVLAAVAIIWAASRAASHLR
jgi:hypothetical protein